MLDSVDVLPWTYGFHPGKERVANNYRVGLLVRSKSRLLYRGAIHCCCAEEDPCQSILQGIRTSLR